MIPVTVAAAAGHLLRLLLFCSLEWIQGVAVDISTSVPAPWPITATHSSSHERAERKQTSSVLCREKLYDYHQRGKYS